jgi:hypothetical protein
LQPLADRVAKEQEVKSPVKIVAVMIVHTILIGMAIPMIPSSPRAMIASIVPLLLTIIVGFWILWSEAEN